jgi:hypothetical protein
MTIQIDGQARRGFIIPARRDAAFTYCCDFEKIFGLVPHLTIVRAYNDRCFRVRYQSTELGVYRIRIYADLQIILDEINWVLRLEPASGIDPVHPQAGWAAAEGHGWFTGQTRFYENEGDTKVVYNFRIQAQVPTPFSACILPPSMCRKIANSIASRRVKDITQSIVNNTLEDWIGSGSTQQIHIGLG